MFQKIILYLLYQNINMELSFIRIWNNKQDLAEIKARHEALGTERFYIDRVDNNTDKMPARAKMLKDTREVDSIRIDTLFEIARNMTELLYVVSAFQRKGAKIIIGDLELSPGTIHMLTAWKKHRDVAKTQKANDNRSKHAGAPKGPRDKAKAWRVHARMKAGHMVKMIAIDEGTHPPSLHRWFAWCEAELKEEKRKLNKEK